MSIRAKLLATHLLMILVSAALMVLFAHVLFHVFVGRLEAVKSHYNLDGDSLEDLIHEEMTVIAELHVMTLNDPDRLLDRGELDRYAALLADRKIDLALVRAGELHYASEGADERLARELPAYRLAPGETHVFRGASLEADGRWIVGFQYAFRFSDQLPGHLYLLFDAEPLGRLANRLVPSLALAFVAAIAAAGAVMTVWVSHRILRPIGRLKLAAEQIREGHLEQPVEIRGHDELAELGRAFEEMRRRLHESVQERLKIEENRKQLIAGITHDLKTPVTAILGYVEGLLDKVADNPERLEKYAKTIHAQARDLDRLIDELFLYSKLDLNSVPFRFEDLDLKDFVNRLAEECRLRLEPEGIRLDVELPEGPAVVRADPEQLKRVFSNVIDNSVKFMDKEEKRLWIRVAPDEREEGFVRVDIRDNGTGIDRQDLPRIFERFYRTDSSRSRDGGGNGLGLAIARQIVKAHGGIIWAESELGKGTTISFTLKEAGLPGPGEGDAGEEA